MKKVIDAIKRAPKRAASLAVVAAAVIVPAVTLAWGPASRPTFTYDKPAGHVTFNSMTNTPNYGDERNFVRVKEAGAANNTYTDSFDLTPGKAYTVMLYFHNNAASNLNDAAHNHKGVAHNTSARFQMPEVVKSGESARLTGFVSADNAQPQTVWDEAYGNATKGDVALRYVGGSAKIWSNGAVDGQSLSDNLFKQGTHLGYDKLDGKLPGCNEYAGFVTFNFVVDQPNFEVAKLVSKAGENKFSDNVNVAAGSEVEYKIQYRNTGTTQQDKVFIVDELPAGVSYVPGSTKFAASTTGGQLSSVKEDSIVSSGLNIGSFAPGANAFVTFRAKVATNDQLAKCGVNSLVNNAIASTDNGTREDTATVTVEKKCETTPPTPVEKHIKVCELTSKKIVTINEKDFDSTKHSKNLKDCEAKPEVEKVKVCDTTTKKIVTISKNQFDKNKHSLNLDDCKEVVTPPTPEEPTTPETPETPVTPTPETPEASESTTPVELPKTGAVGVVGAGLGLSSLVAALAYVATRRRA